MEEERTKAAVPLFYIISLTERGFLVRVFLTLYAQPLFLSVFLTLLTSLLISDAAG